jgi:Tol biopolymer transport system component
MDSEPSFSASGRLVVYTHLDGCDSRTPDGIYAIRSDGSGRRLIRRATSDVEFLANPGLSPSGGLLAFNILDGPTFITSFRRPQRERELSVEPYDSTGQPAWSSTGRLALTLGRSDSSDDRGHIGTVTGAGKDPRLVTRSNRDRAPDWSPTGERIAFHREKDVGAGLKADVLTARARGERRPIRLTAIREAYFPVWSPTGRKIAFVRSPFLSESESSGSLWIMRARDGRRQRLVTPDVALSPISWQPLPR